MTVNRYKKICRNVLFTFLSALLMAGVFSTCAYASSDDKDYTIDGCAWEYNDATGCVTGEWDETNDKTAFTLWVYKSSISESHKLNKTAFRTSNNYYDFSNIIARYGYGDYFFSVEAVKGGSSTRVYSDSFEIDSDEDADLLKQIREYVNYKPVSNSTASSGDSGSALNMGVPLGWKSNPDGTWQYRLTTKDYAKNQWLNINGKWYYFGADGIMLTGWQRVDGKYYFFENSGSCWTGGAVDTSSAQTALAQQNTASTMNPNTATTTNPYNAQTQALKSVTVTFTEGSAAVGKVMPVTLTAPSTVQISEVKYDVPESSWTPGATIKVTVKLETMGNCQFANGVTFTGSNATYKSQSGTDAFSRTVVFEYHPKTKLPKPEKVYLDGTVLHWTKASGARRYNVMILYNEEYTNESSLNNVDFTLFIDETEIVTSMGARSKSITVDTNSIDVSDYMDVEGISDVSFRIYSLPASNKTNYYKTSDPAEFSAAQGNVESDSASGSLTTNSKGELLYLDSSGEGISGWQLIDGSWYYFNAKGVAADPGWKRIDKQWYYFDKNHKMQTGWVEADNYWYYLREQKDENGETGSMATGWFQIGDKSYHLNESTANGIPYGAWMQ